MNADAVSILHIEDRRENRLLVRKLLESRGYAVTDAVDGLAGLQLARQMRPALILIDINIPGLDGYEVVTRLRTDASLAGTPMVAITAEGERDRALALGFDGFIPKPIRVGQFVGQIETFLAGAREHLAGDSREALLADQNQRVVDHLESKVRELTLANERLREVDRLKMEVLRNVSHELSTPLTPLAGYLKMLTGGDLGTLSEPQARVLERMSTSLDRLGAIIGNLLNVTRFATGVVAIERSVITPSAVVEQAVEAVSARAAERGVVVSVEVPDGLPPFIADRGRVVDALRQLLDNAIKFGPPGAEVRVEARVFSAGDPDLQVVELAVSDQGPGISPEYRARVVEPFFQIDGTATRRAGGAGLGLAIADHTARMHDGHLEFSAAPGGGARVALRLSSRPASAD